MIHVERLHKAYKTAVAIDNVSFDVQKGEVVGMLGPNGAGKTTALRIISGYIDKTAGNVQVMGIDWDAAGDSRLAARSLIGYMPETLPLYPEMRVDEYLAHRAALKRVGRRSRRVRLQKAAEKAGVLEVLGVLIGHLSKGYRQRVGLADALLADPPVLILDEPTSGLDPNQIREVRRVIRELGDEHTVLLSTHILSEVEATCSRAVVIDQGRVVAQGSIEELRSLRQAKSADFLVRGELSALRAALTALDGIGSVESQNEGPSLWRLNVALATDANADELMERAVAGLVQAGASVRYAGLSRATLEEVFEAVTRGGLQ